MFVFKPTEKTYADPASATFLPGVPFGREFSKGDICFLHTEFVGSKMFLNSVILREAILNSKEYLEEVLDIKITDTRKESKPVKPTVEDVKEPVAKETVEETIPEVPEEINDVVEESTEDSNETVDKRKKK